MSPRVSSATLLLLAMKMNFLFLLNKKILELTRYFGDSPPPSPILWASEMTFLYSLFNFRLIIKSSEF